MSRAVVSNVISKTNVSSQKLQEKVELGSYTVQFSVTNIRALPPTDNVIGSPFFGTPITPGNITPSAEISWTLTGVTFRRQISVFNGASISGVAEHVVVRVFDETPVSDQSVIVDPGFPGQLPNPPGPHITYGSTEYDVTIALAKGVRGSVSQPPIYVPFISDGAGGFRFGTAIVGPASFKVVPIPQNAGITTVQITAYTSGTLTSMTEKDIEVTQIEAAGALLKTYDPRLLGYVPISPQTDHLELVNHFAGGSGVNIIFSVTFGVDG